jgi:Saposin-like domain
VKYFGPAVIYLFEKYETSDEVCHELGICSSETVAQCHLFPVPSKPQASQTMGKVPSARVRALLPPGFRPNASLTTVQAFSRFRAEFLRRSEESVGGLGWEW